MAARKVMSRPVQLRPGHSDEEAFSDMEADNAQESSSQQDSDSAASDSDQDIRDENQSADDDSEQDETAAEDDSNPLQDISFGALAKAQATFAPRSRKRKLPNEFEPTETTPTTSTTVTNTNTNTDTPQTEQPTEKPTHPKFEPYRTRQPPPTRSSKHAPTIQSSKHAVPRSRTIFSPPPRTQQSRDPRFDPTITSSSTTTNIKTASEKANKNYSFLSTYQADEILALKAQLKKVARDDVEVQSDLKRQLMSLESKIRSGESQRRQQDIVRKHNQAEKEKIRAGQKAKPFYLKDSEVRKLANEQRLEGMGKKARDKAVDRKRKRDKTKEAKFMPRVRREG